jgi:hypothetical protein
MAWGEQVRASAVHGSNKLLRKSPRDPIAILTVVLKMHRCRWVDSGAKCEGGVIGSEAAQKVTLPPATFNCNAAPSNS